MQEYIRDQETLRLKLVDDLRRSKEFQEVSTDQNYWMNYKLIEVFDQMAQFICNRYPLNSMVRRNGPTNTLNNVPVPVGPGKDDVNLSLDVIGERCALVRPYPFDVNPLEVSFPARLVPRRPYASQEDFLRHFYKAERITISYSLHATCT